MKKKPTLNALTAAILLVLSGHVVTATAETKQTSTAKNQSTDAMTLNTMTVLGTAEKKNVNSPDNKDYYIPDAVTATKTDTPLMQIPMSVKVVPQQVMKDQQVITVSEALKNVSGAITGNGSGAGFFFLRGFQNQNVYRDGFLNQSQWFHTEDLANVERVEVLKGPGSILYGRTEPGGLVNFVIKKPLDDPYYSLRQQFGSFGHYRTDIDATGALTDAKDLAYRLNFAYQDNGTFQEFGSNERIFVAPSLRWNISDKTTSTLRVEYSDIKEKGNGTIPLAQNGSPATIPRSRNLSDAWNTQEDEYVMVSLNTEHKFNDDWKLQHRFNFTNYNYTLTGFTPDGDWSPVADNGDFTRSFIAQNTDGKDYQNNFFNALELTGKFTTGFAKHTLLLGGDYYRADYRSTFVGFGANPNFYDTSNIYTPYHSKAAPSINPEDITTTNATLPWFGIYAQDQIDLPYNFHVMGGLRYDNAETNVYSTGEFGTNQRQRSHEDKVSPRAGLVWQPIPELSLYGSYTQNFGASNTISRGTVLAPQTAMQWETGIKTELFDGKFNATLAYFDLKKRGVPVQIDPLTTRAAGLQESRGIEFDFNGEILPGWSVIGAYAYTPFAKTVDNGFDTDPDTGLPIPSAQNGMRLNNAPRNSGSLWTTYEPRFKSVSGLKLGIGMQAVGQREIGYNETAQAPGYVTMDLMASKLWQVGKSRVTTQLNVNNLLDKTYIGNIYSYGPTTYGEPLNFMGSVKIEY